MTQAVAMDSSAARQLRRVLIERRAGRPNDVFAREIGLSESMMRGLIAGWAQPGLDSLSLIVAWEPDLEPLAIEHLRERGHGLRRAKTNEATR